MALTRSQQMARIRGRDTGPELLLRRHLWALGIRYRLHQRIEGCRPDLVIPKARLAVFVDGCFWHGCPRHYVRPRGNAPFWAKKLRENVMRDVRQTARLRKSDWIVLRAWEHEVMVAPEALARRISRAAAAPRPRAPRGWRVLAASPLSRSHAPRPLEHRTLITLAARTRPRLETRRRSTAKWIAPR